MEIKSLNDNLKSLLLNKDIVLQSLENLDNKRIEYRIKNKYTSWRYDVLFNSGKRMTNCYRNIINKLEEFYSILNLIEYYLKLKDIKAIASQLSYMKNLIDNDMKLSENKMFLMKTTQWLQLDCSYKKQLLLYIDAINKIYFTIKNCIGQDKVV